MVVLLGTTNSKGTSSQSCRRPCVVPDRRSAAPGPVVERADGALCAHDFEFPICGWYGKGLDTVLEAKLVGRLWV